MIAYNVKLAFDSSEQHVVAVTVGSHGLQGRPRRARAAALLLPEDAADPRGPH